MYGLLDAVKSTGYILRRKMTMKNLLLFIFLLLVFFLLFSLLSLIRYFIIVFIVLISILLGALSTMYQRITVIPLGVDLVVFVTVLNGVAYGSFVGALVGFCSYFLGQVLTARFNHTTFVSLPAITFLGILAGLFSEVSIAPLGFTLTVVFDAIVIPIYLFLGSDWFKSAVFVVGHIAVNYWLFYHLAGIILEVMV